MLTRLFVLCALFVIQACGESKNTRTESRRVNFSWKQNLNLTNSQTKGLLFAGIDSGYRFSNLYWFDFAESHLKSVIGGQSGDPFLYANGGKTLLFNRTKHLQNVSLLTPKLSSPTPWVRHPEVAFTGNPTAADTDSEGTIWITLYDAGAIALMGDTTTTYPLASLHLTPFRPSDITRVVVNQKEYFLVLHHGLDAMFQPDGSQRLIILQKDPDTGVKIVDVKPVRATTPKFFPNADNTISLIGICTSWLREKGCQSGIDQLNLSDFSLTSVSDLHSFAFVSSGPLAKSSKDHTFYADLTNAKTGERQLARINYGTPSDLLVEPLYTHKSDFGSFLLMEDSSNGTLFYGVSPDGKRGELHIFQGNQLNTVISMPDIPYAGTWIR